MIRVTFLLLFLAAPLMAADKVAVELKLTFKKETIAWPYEVGPKDLEAKLLEATQKKEGGPLPAPPTVDAVLTIKNNGGETLTLHVEGDANTLTLFLKGPGVTTAATRAAFTTDLKLPKAVELEPGKTFEVPLTKLSDGFRRASRNVYPTQPGEYTLSATYQLSTAEGGKGDVLKSNEATLKVSEPSK